MPQIHVEPGGSMHNCLPIYQHHYYPAADDWLTVHCWHHWIHLISADLEQCKYHCQSGMHGPRIRTCPKLRSAEFTMDAQ